MRARLRWARQLQVTRRQLWLSTTVSAAVCVLILISVGGPAGWDAAALDGLQGGVPVAGAKGSGSGSGAGNLSQGAGSLPSGLGGSGSLPGGGSGALGSSPTGGSSPSSGASPSTSSSSSGSSGSGESSSSSKGSGNTGTSTTPKSKSPIKHVFVISLATGDYADAFGPASLAPYLQGTLRPKGELLSDYQTLSGVPLADGLALVGGQRPNADTLNDCPSYGDFPLGSAPNKHNLMSGSGCVYPDTVLTVGDQLDGVDLKWRGFIDGMSSACQHPDSDAAESPQSSGYDVLENPFAFFHSLLDLGDCQSYDLPLTQLDGTLSKPVKKVPSFVYVAADPCDGGASGCSPTSGAPPGTETTTTGTTTATDTTSTATSTSTETTTSPTTTTSGSSAVSDPTVVAADAFLKRVVPKILGSRAYKKDGLLLIVFSGTGGSSQAGARTGALLLSPFVKPGSTEHRPTNAYGVLRTIDNVFGLKALGMARGARPIPLVKKHSD